MAKNRKTVIFLIPVVAIIWGAVIYRFVQTISEEETIKSPVKNNRVKTRFEIEKDTFSLIALDRDPFLGTIYSEKKKGIKKSFTSKEIEWPSVEFIGVVSDADSGSGVYLLNIQGKSHFMKKGGIIDSIQLVKAAGNKVWLKYKNKTRVFQI